MDWIEWMWKVDGCGKWMWKVESGAVPDLTYVVPKPPKSGSTQCPKI